MMRQWLHRHRESRETRRGWAEYQEAVHVYAVVLFGVVYLLRQSAMEHAFSAEEAAKPSMQI